MKKTKNYDAFRLLETNREIKPGYVKKIKNSILEKNLLAYNPIIVNKDMIVIDGQHRLEAARQLDTEIYYVIAKFANAKDVRNLNSSQSRWTMEDFVKSFAKTNPDYQYLWDFSQSNSLPLSVASLILSNFTSSGSSASIRNGNFKVKNTKQVIDFMNIIKKIQPFLSNVARRDGVFNSTVNVLNKKKDINWDRMIIKADAMSIAQDNKEIIVKQTNRLNYLRIFEDIYNYRSKKTVRLF